ncbi:MAG TPA: hypothetical protein VFY34_19885 [Pyrinomonadaceae bacterium]|nr:hypothetical protein [Pyrinomonadaceae bacterium]
MLNSRTLSCYVRWSPDKSALSRLDLTEPSSMVTTGSRFYASAESM